MESEVAQRLVIDAGIAMPGTLTCNGFAAEVPWGRASKEATARHGPSPARDGVFTDNLANHPT